MVNSCLVAVAQMPSDDQTILAAIQAKLILLVLNQPIAYLL